MGSQRGALSDDSAGKLAIASKRVAEEGRKVRFMYREDPAGPADSGWKFFCGDDSQEYVDNPDNVGEFPLEKIAATDPAVARLLDTPAPCAFERDSEDGEFVESDFDMWLEE